MSNLREKLAKLANDNPDGIREHLVPLLKEAAGDTILGGYEKFMTDLAKTIVSKMQTPAKIQNIRVNIPDLIITVMVDGKKVKLGVLPDYDSDKTELTVYSKSQKTNMPNSKASTLNIAKFFDEALS